MLTVAGIHSQARATLISAKRLYLLLLLTMPQPLQLPLLEIDWDKRLYMRGDWLQYGRRPAMERAQAYLQRLPMMTNMNAVHGPFSYWPLPWRHLVHIGASGLRGHFWGWLNWPSQTAERRFGIPGKLVAGNPAGLVDHIRTHLAQLEEWELAGGGAALTPGEVVTGRPFNRQPRPGPGPHPSFPEGEAGFLYHVLASGLEPRSAADSLGLNAMRMLMHGRRKECTTCATGLVARCTACDVACTNSSSISSGIPGGSSWHLPARHSGRTHVAVPRPPH